MVKSVVGVVEGTVDEPALGFSYAIQLDDKKALTLQTYLPRSCKLPALNAILDVMSAAADRQAAKSKIKALKYSLHMQTKNLKRSTEDLYAIDERVKQAWKASGKKADFRYTTDQEAHRRNAVTTQERFAEEINDIKREIAELEALTGG